MYKYSIDFHLKINKYSSVNIYPTSITIPHSSEYESLPFVPVHVHKEWWKPYSRPTLC